MTTKHVLRIAAWSAICGLGLGVISWVCIVASYNSIGSFTEEGITFHPNRWFDPLIFTVLIFVSLTACCRWKSLQWYDLGSIRREGMNFFRCAMPVITIIYMMKGQWSVLFIGVISMVVLEMVNGLCIGCVRMIIWTAGRKTH